MAERSREILEVKKEVFLEVGLFSDLHVNVLVEFISNILMKCSPLRNLDYGCHVWLWCCVVPIRLPEFYKHREAQAWGSQESTCLLDQVRYGVDSQDKVRVTADEKETGRTTQVGREREDWLVLEEYILEQQGLKWLIQNTHQIELSACDEKIKFLTSELETMDRAHKDNFNYYKEIIDEQKKH